MLLYGFIMLNKKIPFIVSEIGSNHNGNLSRAKKLIYLSKQCGCDAVKFQSFDADLFSNKIYDINYQFELLLKNEKNDKRHKIFLWIVSICEYLSHKDEKDYNHFDKVLTIIIGEVYELFNR